MLHLGSSPCQNQGTTKSDRCNKKRQVSLLPISAGMMELIDMRDLVSVQ